ncbi:DNA polymerase III subunit [Thermoflexibacter ruber]|uniref:DNA polymerase-3 subunit delta n=1 Tax=Thermoflexibacter ruber TaxID=1003 RepID=A0A1I2ELQ6_9BACT|nr:DNA polymerase III subunit delta' [Thermoflexibacter ruber]SFE93719.1 DNA polymerase-3 subunit delta' [Thermoflexibacter ruber]
MQFSQIIGLEDIKQTLVQSVNKNHVAHAQLFLGIEGSANLALAVAYATFLNCENKTETSTDSCGTCPSCYKMNRLIHPDLHFIFPTATTKQITKRDEAVSQAFMKEWREFFTKNPYNSLKAWSLAFGAEGKQCIIPVEDGRNIIRSLALKAFEAEYKVLIIWLPELMNVNAANAILKILEEPPEKTIFLLVANSAENMLATIQSRTQLVLIRPFKDEEIKKHLTEVWKTDEERASQIAMLADGNMNEAYRLLNDTQNLSQDTFRDWMRLCFRFDIPNLIKEADKFNDLEKEAQKSLLQYGMNLLREAFVYKFGGEHLVRADKQSLEFIKNFSKVIHEANVEKLQNKFNEAYFHLERNANSKILFLDLSLQVAGIFKQ